MTGRSRRSGNSRSGTAEKRPRGTAADRWSGLPDQRPSRVVVETVSPVVRCGAFPAKASLGAPVVVLADVFTDGHDRVAAALRWRRLSDTEGGAGADEDPAGGAPVGEVRMEPIGNDRYRGTFTPDRMGTWEFDVAGWRDDFSTRFAAIGAKHAAGQDVSVELLGLAPLLRQMREAAEGDDVAAIEALGAACSQGRVEDLLAAGDPEGLSWRTQPREPLGLSGGPGHVFVDCERARFSAWYELFPRSLGDPRDHGTLGDVGDQLDRIAGMGFDIVYLPPVHPIGTTYRKGPDNTLVARDDDPGSPWAIGSPAGGHTSVHPELGTVADVRALADSCREKGMDLALDIAFQCSPDHPWVREHPEWFEHRADGSIQYAENPPKKYQDIYPLDFDSEEWAELWQALHEVICFWADAGVRVFRVDNPHTKAFAFWQWLLAEFRRHDPDVLFLAEAFTRPRVMERLAAIGFHQSYTYFTWRPDPTELREYAMELDSSAPMMRPNFWPNTPDILHEQLQQGGRPAFVVRAVLASMLSPNWGIYGPAFELQEAEPREQGSEEYASSEKYQLREWDLERADSLEPLVGRLNAIRRGQPALQHHGDLWFHHCDDPAMLAWSRTDPNGVGDPVLVVVAADPGRDAQGEVDVDWARLGLAYDSTYELVDHLGGGTYSWSGARNFVKLSPTGLAAHVFTVTGPATGGDGT
jgi:starch synthase (maltosyl-transferring)